MDIPKELEQYEIKELWLSNPKAFNKDWYYYNVKCMAQRRVNAHGYRNRNLLKVRASVQSWKRNNRDRINANNKRKYTTLDRPSNDLVDEVRAELIDTDAVKELRELSMKINKLKLKQLKANKFYISREFKMELKLSNPAPFDAIKAKIKERLSVYAKGYGERNKDRLKQYQKDNRDRINYVARVLAAKKRRNRLIDEYGDYHIAHEEYLKLVYIINKGDK